MIPIRKPTVFYGVVTVSLFLCVVTLLGVAVYAFLPQFLVNNDKSTLMNDEQVSLGSNLEKAEYYFTSEVYDIEKARQHYELAVLEAPKANPLPWYQLSRIDFIQGRFDAAIAKLDTQLKYFGDEIPNVYYMKGLVHAFRANHYNGQTSDWQDAEMNFRQFLTYEPTSPWARIDLAWVYFAQDKFDEMFEVLEPVKDAERENPWWLNMYGLAYLNTGQAEKALYWFQKAEQQVGSLTVEDWARVYPENNPADWPQGLREFQAAIRDNVVIAKTRVADGGEN